MLWISFDLDWATGDCRGARHYCCSWECDGCMGQFGVGRGLGDPRPDALDRFAAMREWLLSLQIGAIYLYDCHAEIVQFLSPGDKVLNYDEHSDNENTSTLDCGSWVNYAREMNIAVNQMNSMPFPDIAECTQLFIAMSLPYTSQICDTELSHLVTDIQKKVTTIEIQRQLQILLSL